IGAPGVCTAPTMQFASPGSVHSSSRVPLVSWYQTGNPLVSLIGPTALRPSVPLLCAGGGASAWEATIAPDAAIANAAAPTVRVRRLRVMRASLFIAFSLQMTLRAVRSAGPESWVVSRCSRPCELVLRFGVQSTPDRASGHTLQSGGGRNLGNAKTGGSGRGELRLNGPV